MGTERDHSVGTVREQLKGTDCGTSLWCRRSRLIVRRTVEQGKGGRLRVCLSWRATQYWWVSGSSIEGSSIERSRWASSVGKQQQWAGCEEQWICSIEYSTCSVKQWTSVERGLTSVERGLTFSGRGFVQRFAMC